MLTVRAPRSVELAFRRLTLMSGDMSRVFLFALARLDLDSLPYINTMSKRSEDVLRRPKLGKAFLVKVGVSVRARLSRTAKENKVPVNCVAVSVLTALKEMVDTRPLIKRELLAQLRSRRDL